MHCKCERKKEKTLKLYLNQNIFECEWAYELRNKYLIQVYKLQTVCDIVDLWKSMMRMWRFTWDDIVGERKDL